MLILRNFSKKEKKDDNLKLYDRVSTWTTKNLMPRKLRKSYKDWAGEEKHKGRGMSALTGAIAGGYTGAMTKNAGIGLAAAGAGYAADRLGRRLRNKLGSPNTPIYMKERDRIDMIEGKMSKKEFKKKWKC